MKKLSKKLLAVLLIITMLVPTGIITVISNADNEECLLVINVTNSAGEITGFDVTLSFANIVTASVYSIENSSLKNSVVIPISDVIHSIVGGMENFIALAQTTTVSILSEVTLPFSRTLGYYITIESADGVQYYSSDVHTAEGGWFPTEDNYTAFTDIVQININESLKNYPDGYDFYADSYNFENHGALIVPGYFKTMYGKSKGYELWKNQGYQGGLCFGFAYTTAAFYNNLPSVSSIRDLKESSKLSIGNNELSVETYIKYAHIYQFSMEFKNNSVWSNAQTIYNLVKKATEDNNLLVTIGMTKKTGGGHRVLAIGVDGNDILIDDPNFKDEIQRISIDNNGYWSFSGLDGYNSDTCNIRYSMDISEPFKFIKSLKPLTVNKGFIDNNTIDSISSSFEADILSEDYLLLSVSGDDYNISNTNISEIEREYTENTAAAELNDLYWIAEDSTVKITDISNNSSVELAGNENIIGVTVSDSSQIELTVDEENDILSAALNTTKNNEYSLSVTTFDDDSNAVILTLTGTAAGGEIAATETDGGMQVTGLNDITVTYETADGTDTAAANITDGRAVRIVTDDASNSVDFDWNCSHLCHNGNEFIQFIWKIASFIYRIFGINQYCDCGMAHW